MNIERALADRNIHILGQPTIKFWHTQCVITCACEAKTVLFVNGCGPQNAAVCPECKWGTYVRHFEFDIPSNTGRIDFERIKTLSPEEVEKMKAEALAAARETLPAEAKP